jgi:RHS repeat-associated protein
MGSIYVILIVLSSLLAGGNVWGQGYLEISGANPSMSCGGSQNLSASGGCPPYTWSLSGGGTLTPSGGDNTSATYDAPASNTYCADNAMITLTDYCGNLACIKLAVNCYTDPDIIALGIVITQMCPGCGESEYRWCSPLGCDQGYSYPCFEGWRYQWRCDGALLSLKQSHACGYYCGGAHGSHLAGPDDSEPNDQNPPDTCYSVSAGCPCGGLNCNCNEMYDCRSESEKEQGCCPLDPATELPFDDEDLNCEDEAKGKGRCLNFICPTGTNPTNSTVANPVNVANGNKYEEVLDLTISTPGIPLEFRRSYNSKIIFNNPLGYGWTHTYDLSLVVVQTSPTKRVRIWDSDGRALYFSEAQQTPTEILFSGESGVKDKLKQIISTGEYYLRRKEGNLTYKFGSDGKLLLITDPNGNTLTLTYTGGLLTQVSNNFGKSLSIQYSGNRIASVTDPKNQSILYEYTNGNLTKVTYPDQNFISYAYSGHNLTDKYNTNNNLIGHWGYDNRHRVTNYYSHIKDFVQQEEINLSYHHGSTDVTRSTGTTIYTIAKIDGIKVVEEIQGCSTCGSVNKSFQYSDRLDLTQITSIDGTNQYTTQYTYDNPTNPWEQVGEILQMTEALGWPEQRTTSYTYTHRADDPFLLTQSTETIRSVVDPQNNKVITFSYDNQGNILYRQEAGYEFIYGVSTSKTSTTTYQYNTLGQLTQINGPRTDVSDITTIEYYTNTPGEGNNRGQLKAIVNALNQRTEFSNYDANGNVGTITDPNGVITQRTYDERNRIKTITNQTIGAQTQYFYDARGNLSYIILPEGNQINLTYNLANKLEEIKDSLNNKILYQYDVEGNRIHEEIKDPQGILKKYLDFTYDAYNNLKRIINPDSTYTEYTYDGRKNPITSKDPKNNTTLYIYDSLSRIIQMTQPLSTITDYGYDTQDNQTSITDPNGNVTNYYSDDFGRKNQTGSPDTGTTDYLYYDGAGNLTQRVDAKETVVNYTYGALNRLTAIQFPSDPTQNVTFTYDSTSVTYGIGRLTGRIDPSGSYTFYYDAQGNLIKEEKTISGILYTTQYGYNKNNVLTSITYPSGRTITYTLDGAGRISQVDTTLNGNPKTLASNINYLPFGGVTSLTYGNTLTLTQGYDNQYRILSIVTGSILNLTFGYDPNGNITSILDGVNPPGGEVLETPGGYSYQQGTNKLTHIERTPPIDYGYDANGNITSINNRTFIYDLSNQLIRVEDNGTPIAQYVYNGIGQRIKKNAQGSVRVFHYNHLGYLISETTETGQTLVEYIYLGNKLLALIQGEQVYYFHNDHLGTPQVLTNDNGSIAWKATYAPFGEAQVLIETVKNPFRFMGQYYDQETGLHYNYFRYYDPKTGRYITPDPIGLWGGINLFSYVANSPLHYIDPYGLDLIGSQVRDANGNTVFYFYDTDTGAEYFYRGITEPAPQISPTTGEEYGPYAKLPPARYELIPRPDPGPGTFVLPKNAPVYTTPGKEAGIVIDPSGNIRTWIGPHVGTKSTGCPLFPKTEQGKKDKASFDFLINFYYELGPVTITIREEK